MSNKIRIMGAIFLILFLFLSNQIVKGNKNLNPGDNTVNTVNTGELKFISKEIKEENKELNYSLKASYPQLDAYSNTEIQKNFNNRIYSVVIEKIDAFKKEVVDYQGNPQMPSSFLMEYSVVNNRDNLASIKFLTETYYSQSAHPSHEIFTFNYNLKNDDIISLADLFKKDTNYLKIISDYCISDLTKQITEEGYKPDASWIAEGGGPKAENFRCFNLTGQSLIIIFQEYQVAPYVEGIKEVTIPYSKLKEVINPEWIYLK